MVQKEVGERLLAGPGLEAYSALSCYAGFYARTEFLGIVRRTSFFPQPKVDSALLRLTFLEKGSVAVNDETLLFEVIRAAFNQRRKTILTSLGNKGIKGLKRQEIKAVLERARIDAQRRPETLSLHEFARISDELKR
jgi:16S rRNA (adenine1518-N6/adenine1519-N6)-dimethyltransferase